MYMHTCRTHCNAILSGYGNLALLHRVYWQLAKH